MPSKDLCFIYFTGNVECIAHVLHVVIQHTTSVLSDREHHFLVNMLEYVEFIVEFLFFKDHPKANNNKASIIKM